MYLIKQNNKLVDYTEYPIWTALQKNGVNISTTQEKANGVVANGVMYNLIGTPPNGHEVVIVEQVEDTIELARGLKIFDIKGHCSATIERGVIVDGKRYILSKYDGQNSLQNALVKAEKGENPIPFSAFGENKPSPYTPEQIKTIAKAADEWGTVNITYYGYLKDWIARETDVDILNSIEYGVSLPDDLMQELATKLSQFGIDITEYSAMLGGKD